MFFDVHIYVKHILYDKPASYSSTYIMNDVFCYCDINEIWEQPCFLKTEDWIFLALTLYGDIITWQSYVVFNVKVLGYWLKIGCWQKKMIVILERQTILESIFCLHSCPNMRHEPIIVHPVFKKIDTLYPTAHNNSFTKNNH